MTIDRTLKSLVRGMIQNTKAKAGTCVMIVSEMFDRLNLFVLFRHYRPAHVETPTYTGGLSKQAAEKLERLKKPHNRGVHYSTADSKDKRDRHRDRRSC